MGLLIKITSFLLIIILSSVFAGTVKADGPATIPESFTATYQVLHKNRRLANVTVMLSRNGNNWRLHGYTHDTRGLASLLKVRGTQTTTGWWQEGRFYPEDYQFAFSLIGYKTAWFADFDWATGTVTSKSRKWHKVLPMEGGLVDPLSLSMNIGLRLLDNPHKVAISVLDEDKIDQQFYQQDRDETFDTALGCVKATRVSRVRSHSKRTSIFWYADDYAYLPILIRHAKNDGNDFKLKIISLAVGGKPIQAASKC